MRTGAGAVKRGGEVGRVRVCRVPDDDDDDRAVYCSFPESNIKLRSLFLERTVNSTIIIMVASWGCEQDSK